VQLHVHEAGSCIAAHKLPQFLVPFSVFRLPPTLFPWGCTVLWQESFPDNTRAKMNVVLREWNLNISSFEGAKQIKVQCAFHLPCGHPTAIDPYEQFKEEGAITKR